MRLHVLAFAAISVFGIFHGAQAATLPSPQVEYSAERIEGFDTKKYKMLMKDGAAGGFIWITEHAVAVKMDMVSNDGAKKSRVTMTLKNLQIGPQDAQLFELPNGLTAMPSMGSLGMRP